MQHARPISRRQALIGGMCLCCAPALRAAQGPLGPLETQEIAPGIHVRRGVHEIATPRNADAIANVGFVIGSRSVAVIDPGGSIRDGERLRERIRQVTKRPIRYVLMSHVHPDHIFGAGAFLQDKPVFVGHAELPNALAQRGAYYRERLEEVLGKGAAGPVVQPSMLVQDRSHIDLGERRLELQAHPLAHTNNDLTAYDATTGTLFASDLLFVERVPSLDGSLKGWLTVLDALSELDVKRAVPGHGPASVAFGAASQKLRSYLQTILVETRKAIAAGMDIDAAPDLVAHSERSKWLLFDDYHGHNVTQAFRELEWE